MQQTATTRWFSNLSAERRCFYLMCVLSAAPLLFSRYPPMVDIPQHASQVATLNRLLFTPDYPYQQLFQINWTNPYWGGYLPVLLLSTFLPIHLAIKLVLALAIISVPLAVSRLTAYFKCDPMLDWLALPIGYGFAFQWGMLNFLMGVPVVLVYLLFVFRYAASPNLRSGLVLLLFWFLLFVMHLLIAAFGTGMGTLYVFAGKGSWKTKFLTVLPLVGGMPIAVGWLAHLMATAGQMTEPGLWDLNRWRPLEFVTFSIGEPFGRLSLALGLLVFALPFLLGYRLTRDVPRRSLFAVLVLWHLFGPNYILGNWYTYHRFSIFSIPLFLLLISPTESLSRYRHYLRGLAVIVPLLLLSGHCSRIATFEAECDDYRALLREMEPGKRTLMLIPSSLSRSYHGPQFLHLPAWYQAELGGVVDFSFAQFPLQVRYRPDADVAIPRNFEWEPNQFNWYRNRGWLYDYFIVKHHRDFESRIFEDTSCPVTFVTKSGDWRLYATDKAQCRPVVDP